MTTSDLISEDLAGRSFVLYFSRAVKVRDYLAGKGMASVLVMSIMCAIPPVAVADASMATQPAGSLPLGAVQTAPDEVPGHPQRVECRVGAPAPVHA